MSEYALYKGRPVKVNGSLYETIRDKEGKAIGQGAFLGMDVTLPFGHRLFARPENLDPIQKPEYERLVKEEKAEKELLSKKEGFGSCEFLALKKHGTNAAQERGR